MLYYTNYPNNFDCSSQSLPFTILQCYLFTIYPTLTLHLLYLKVIYTYEYWILKPHLSFHMQSYKIVYIPCLPVRYGNKLILKNNNNVPIPDCFDYVMTHMIHALICWWCISVCSNFRMFSWWIVPMKFVLVIWTPESLSPWFGRKHVLWWPMYGKKSGM